MGGWLFLGNVYCENLFAFFVWFHLALFVAGRLVETKPEKSVRVLTRELLTWAAVYDVAMVSVLAAMGEHLYAAILTFCFMVFHSEYRAALKGVEEKH